MYAGRNRRLNVTALLKWKLSLLISWHRLVKFLAYSIFLTKNYSLIIQRKKKRWRKFLILIFFKTFQNINYYREWIIRFFPRTQPKLTQSTATHFEKIEKNNFLTFFWSVSNYNCICSLNSFVFVMCTYKVTKQCKQFNIFFFFFKFSALWQVQTSDGSTSPGFELLPWVYRIPPTSSSPIVFALVFLFLSSPPFFPPLFLSEESLLLAGVTSSFFVLLWLGI